MDQCCPPLYVVTHTHTAECPAGFSGDAVTRTVQYKSHISEAHARCMAIQKAMEEANAALVCVAISGYTPPPAGMSLLWT